MKIWKIVITVSILLNVAMAYLFFTEKFKEVENDSPMELGLSFTGAISAEHRFNDIYKLFPEDQKHIISEEEIQYLHEIYKTSSQTSSVHIIHKTFQLIELDNGEAILLKINNNNQGIFEIYGIKIVPKEMISLFN